VSVKRGQDQLVDKPKKPSTIGRLASTGSDFEGEEYKNLFKRDLDTLKNLFIMGGSLQQKRWGTGRRR
jgi:hypothetical protein